MKGNTGDWEKMTVQEKKERKKERKKEDKLEHHIKGIDAINVKLVNVQKIGRIAKMRVQ